MPIFRSKHSGTVRRSSWQEYQNRLNRNHRSRSGRRWGLVLVSACAALLVGLYIGWESPVAAIVVPAEPEAVSPTAAAALSKKDVQLLLSHARIENLDGDQISLLLRQHNFHLETSLNTGLQTHLLDAMDRKNSRYVAIVVMDPDTGRILSLVGFNKSEPELNPCLKGSFPAASIFKIITAAAAVEVCGLEPGSPLSFNGDKYTLYKSQLKDTNNRYTHTLSFGDSFAQSVNPVFGKLGMGRLQKSILEKYGDAFGFNHPIEFELPVDPSRLQIDDTPYHWAEIASGFNKDTTLSPVHAAMLVSAVLNQGEIILPTIVDRIIDDQGTVLYQSRQEHHGRAMTDQAAKVLVQLMEATVRSGTARAAFRNKGRDRVLAGLTVGGKTGSISNRIGDVRFDWFVGFAQSRNGQGRLAVAAMVGHEEYIGVRAATYARKAMSYHFGHLVAHKNGAREKKADPENLMTSLN